MLFLLKLLVFTLQSGNGSILVLLEITTSATVPPGWQISGSIRSGIPSIIARIRAAFILPILHRDLQKAELDLTLETLQAWAGPLLPQRFLQYLFALR